jgi:prepilin-type N-terminal cleavage/methylation domain-containing protein
MKKSNGYTLVEMLVVITVAGVLLSIAAQLVTRAMRIDTTWREHGDIARSMSRLAHDLRQDIHQARSVIVTQDPQALELTRADGAKVSYTVATEEIIRSSQRDDEQLEREYYKISADQQVEMRSLPDTPQVELQVTQAVKHMGEPPRMILHVSAEVGRLLRLSRYEELADE